MDKVRTQPRPSKARALAAKKHRWLDLRRARKSQQVISKMLADGEARKSASCAVVLQSPAVSLVLNLVQPGRTRNDVFLVTQQEAERALGKRAGSAK